MGVGVAKTLTDFVARGIGQPDKPFDQLLEALPVAVYTTDSTGRLTYFNAAAARFAGRVPEVGDRWCITWKLFRPDGTPLAHDQCPMAVALAGGEAPTGAECIAERPDGTRLWFTPYPVILRAEDGRIVGGINLLFDITQRKAAEIQAQAALQQLRLIAQTLGFNERQLKEAQRLAKVGSWDREVDGATSYWSEQIFRILGLPSDASAALSTFLERVHPKDRQKILDSEDIVRSTCGPNELDYRIIRPNGELRFVHSVVEAIRDERGIPMRLTGAIQDVTEQVEARERLRQSEQHLKNAERLAKLGHWSWEPRTDQVIWSEESVRIFGQPPGYAPTYEGFFHLITPEDRPRYERAVRDSLADKRGFKAEFDIARPDGELRTIRSIGEVSLDEDSGLPTRLFGTVQDITDEKRAQRESFARQKLESVGTLAGGVAHDFNNLLGAALSEAELGLAQLEAGLSAQEQLQAIRDVALRGSEIVRQLMIYAGKESAVIEFVDVSAVVKEMIELLKVSVSKRVTLELSLADAPPAVRANTAQLRQIVMNLVINASEAIGTATGVIRISTKETKAKRRYSGRMMDPMPGRDYVELEVCDTGKGMAPEIQAQIFDPFFTTKTAGHGLGLATVQGLVSNLGGAIDLHSQPDKGTTFRILLPCTESPQQAARDTISREERSSESCRDATILIVEDEDPLRQAVAKMLRNNRFEVIEAGDGSAAIDLLHMRSFDLILLDLTLPGASSREILAEAAQTQPQAKVILTSAYGPEILKHRVDAPMGSFIRKPFQLADLLKTIRGDLRSS